jgi:hypothetical protein
MRSAVTALLALMASVGLGVAPANAVVIADNSQIAPFLDDVYHDLLNRAPDPGAAVFAAQLHGGADTAAVATEVLTSAEFRGDLVRNDFTTFPHRPAGAVDVAALGGLSQWSLAQAILTSAEYRGDHPMEAGYVDGLYQDLLGRPADPGGIAAFTGLYATAMGDVDFKDLKSTPRRVTKTAKMAAANAAHLAGLLKANPVPG